MSAAMLVKVWIAVFWIALGKICLAQEVKYPSYETVVARFFKSYHFAGEDGQVLRFEKKPLGWFIRKMGADQRLQAPQLFWDKDSLVYRPLDFPVQRPDAVIAVAQMSPYLHNEFEKRCFRLFPFYGYEGWDSDFIDAYRRKTKLGDTLLQALGRAYSLHSSNMLNNNSGLADPKYSFSLPSGKNSLTAEQLRTYRKYRHQAIDCYKRLYRLNPHYETLIGNAYTHMSNEHMVGFLELRIYQNEKEAFEELERGLYSDFMISTAKNFLNSCDSNAILFTGGDTDTYPLLYVQAQYGHRTDVSVVNLSLLNTDRYINSFREKIGRSEPLPLSFSRMQTASENLYFIHLQDHEGSASVSSLIEFVSNEYNAVNGFYSFPSNRLKLYRGSDTLSWTLDKPYLTKGELMLLDIINNNRWERPICFSASMGRNNYLCLHKYLHHRGLVYQLVPSDVGHVPQVYGSVYVNTNTLYELLLNGYDWKGILSRKGYEKTFVAAYRQSFIMLSQQLILEKKYIEAKRVMDFCIALFPSDQIPLDYTTVYFIENHYKIDEIAQANQIAKAFLYDINHQLGDFKSPDAAYVEAVKDYLRDFFSRYHQEEMLNLIDEPY